jgi:hypothetical protein
LHGVQRAHSVLVERARQQFAILGESRVFHIPRVVRQIFRLLLLPDQKWLCFQIQTCHLNFGERHDPSLKRGIRCYTFTISLPKDLRTLATSVALM